MSDVATRAGRYITFQLARQYFAIPTERVRQILPANGIRTTVGQVPYLCGAIPTNGRLIPVLDIRRKLGLSTRPVRPNASVLILGLNGNCPVKMVGMVADKLTEVVEYRATEIHGSTAQQRVEGRPYGRPKTLLAPEELLLPGEWSELQSLVF
jgi:purine-binding chemotaxis protein CheW